MIGFSGAARVARFPVSLPTNEDGQPKAPSFQCESVPGALFCQTTDEERPTEVPTAAKHQPLIKSEIAVPDKPCGPNFLAIYVGFPYPLSRVLTSLPGIRNQCPLVMNDE